MPTSSNIGFFQDVVEMVREGDFDDYLESLRLHIIERQRALGQSKDFTNATRVKVTGRLKPNYLMGMDFAVTKVNPKTVEVLIDPPVRRFSGRTRIPKTALTVVA